MSWVFNDDGVSETLGYILIFGIVLGCIAFILLTGNNVLDASKAQNNFKNIEQAFTVLNSDLKQVALEGTPVKTTRMHLEGGVVSTDKNVNRITISYDNGVGSAQKYDKYTGNIKFKLDRDNSIVSVENGGIWESQDSTSDVAVLNPRIYMSVDPTTSERTLVLNMVKLEPSTSQAVSGPETIGLALEFEDTNVFTYDSATGKEVDITFYTDYPDAWSKFFLENGAISAVPSSNYVTVKYLTVSHLVISEHIVDVTIQ